jgi:hypothetical protein
MLVPNRHASADSYRYGFNTQEKVDEISGEANHNTAKFWEYDTRTARRWNQDPKPNHSISNYSVFASNPIFNNDILGDTLKVANDKQSIKDIKSLVRGRNKKFIEIDANGGVTLNFSTLNKKLNVVDVLREDQGLSVINDLISSDKDFLYEASPLVLIRDDAGNKTTGYTYRTGHGIVNASNFGQDSNGGHQHRPRFGFDGQVIIGPKVKYEEADATGNIITKPRAAIVFHELVENYQRTHNNINYNGLNGAHELAKTKERLWNQKSNMPGELTGLILEKSPNRKTFEKWNIITQYYINH